LNGNPNVGGGLIATLIAASVDRAASNRDDSASILSRGIGRHDTHFVLLKDNVAREVEDRGIEGSNLGDSGLVGTSDSNNRHSGIQGDAVGNLYALIAHGIAHFNMYGLHAIGGLQGNALSGSKSLPGSCGFLYGILDAPDLHLVASSNSV